MFRNTYSFRKKTSFFLFLILLSFITILAGCSSQSSSQTQKTETKQEEPKAGSGSDNVREITHAMGTTEITGTPERVVTLFQGATDTAVALGVKPAGIVESWLEQPIYEYLRNDLEGTPIVGLETQPNLEEIAKLKPDLIVASKIRSEEIYDQLSQIAPTVMTDNVYTFKDTVELMGQAMNKEEKANELISAWDTRVSDFKGKIEEKLGDQWPFSVSILNFREDHARIYVTDSFAGLVLSELGFARPESQQGFDEPVVKLTDKESIPQMNADVFYMFMNDEEAVQKNFEEWTNHPLWKNLDAVKADQVYRVDEIIWNMGGGMLAANLMLDDIYSRFELEK